MVSIDAQPGCGIAVPSEVAGALVVVPDAAVWLDGDGVVRAANDLAEQMFRGRMVGRSFRDLVTLSGPAGGRRPGEGRRLDDVPFPVEVSTGPAGGGSVVTLREPHRAALVSTVRSHFDAAFQTSPIGMALFGPDGQYIRVNEALGAMLGRRPRSMLGRRDQEFTHPDDRQADVDAAWEILRGERDTHQTEKRFVRPDGSVVWVIANMAFLRDELDRPISWIGQFQDISDRRRTEESLRQMADHDPLTGLLNRRAFGREVDALLAGGRAGALLVLDLDGFKAINDAFGHRAGDDVLRRCAAALGGMARPTDLVARLGGDEFAIFAPGLSQPALQDLACIAARAVRDVGIAAARDTGPTAGDALDVSIGAARTADVGLCAESLMAEADRRMYARKLASR